ncbi:MAG: DoxX family protein, partial [Pseudorhodoplanes sp.]
LLGLFTSPAAFILSGTMAFEYLIGNAPLVYFQILNNGNLAILYCFVFFYLSFAGGGPLSLDAILRKKS